MGTVFIITIVFNDHNFCHHQMAINMHGRVIVHSAVRNSSAASLRTLETNQACLINQLGVAKEDKEASIASPSPSEHRFAQATPKINTSSPPMKLYAQTMLSRKTQGVPQTMLSRTTSSLRSQSYVL
jgi:hypothetical protein